MSILMLRRCQLVEKRKVAVFPAAAVLYIFIGNEGRAILQHIRTMVQCSAEYLAK